jgi:hypothetical protein
VHYCCYVVVVVVGLCSGLVLVVTVAVTNIVMLREITILLFLVSEYRK